MTFPSFYAECAYNDGFSAAATGDYSSASSYMRHGEPEPIGMEWFNIGVKSANKRED